MLVKLIAFRELSVSSRGICGGDGDYFEGSNSCEQSVWGLGASWPAVEICLLAAELGFLPQDKGFAAHSGYIYLALAGNASN